MNRKKLEEGKNTAGRIKKTIIGIAGVVIMSLLLQSCFEIKEIITINKDGSGTFSMIIDLSEVKTMMEGFSEGNSAESESPLGGMEEEYEAMKSKLEYIDGISNIERLTENDGYLVSSSFDFANIEALNKGMNVIYEDENEDGSITEYYKLKGKNFERTALNNFLEDFKEEMGTEELADEDMNLSEIFTDVSYVNMVTFKDARIKKSSNSDIEISDDGSTMTLKRYIFREDADLSMDYVLKVK